MMFLYAWETIAHYNSVGNPSADSFVPINPLASGVKVPTIDEISRMLMVAKREPWPTLIVLAVTTGMPRGELAALRVCDIHLPDAGPGLVKVPVSASSSPTCRGPHSG